MSHRKILTAVSNLHKINQMVFQYYGPSWVGVNSKVLNDQLIFFIYLALLKIDNHFNKSTACVYTLSLLHPYS